MRKTTIRELKHETAKVLSWVADGETVEVRLRNKPVAVVGPPAGGPNPERPDFAARLVPIYGDQVSAVNATWLIREARGMR